MACHSRGAQRAADQRKTFPEHNGHRNQAAHGRRRARLQRGQSGHAQPGQLVGLVGGQRGSEELRHPPVGDVFDFGVETFLSAASTYGGCAAHERRVIRAVVEDVRLDRTHTRDRQGAEVHRGAQFAQNEHHLERPRGGVVGQRHGAPARVQRQARLVGHGDHLLAERGNPVESLGPGQVRPTEVGDLAPVQSRTLRRVVHRDALFPARPGEVRLEDGEHRVDRRAGRIPEHPAATREVRRERVGVAGREALLEGVRAQHEHTDGLADGRPGGVNRVDVDWIHRWPPRVMAPAWGLRAYLVADPGNGPHSRPFNPLWPPPPSPGCR